LPRSFSLKFRFRYLTENVKQKLVRFLDARSRVRANNQVDVGGTCREAASFAQQCDSLHFAASCLFNGGEDIARLSACRQGNQNIAGLCECLYLTREDLLKTVVVANRGEQPPIGA